MADDAAPSRQWSVVKGSSEVNLAKRPGGPLANLWREDVGILAEELESEVSEDEDAGPIDWRLRRGKQKFRPRRAKEREARWRMQSPDGSLVGTREGGQIATWIVLKETAPGVLEVTKVQDWFNFRVPTNAHKRTLTSEEANEHYKASQKAAAKGPPKARSKLEAKLNAIDADYDGFGATPQGGRGGGGGGGKAPKTTAADTELYGGSSGIGLSAAGEDLDARGSTEGIAFEGYSAEDGIDFDCSQEFDDDEADGEKHDNEGLNFHDDDDGDKDDGEDDETREAKKKAKETLAKAKEEIANAKPDEEMEEAPPEAEGAKKRKQEEEEAAQGEKKRPRRDPSRDLIAESEVRAEIIGRGGRVKTKELLLCFKKRLKANPDNKGAISTHLKALADIVDDPIDGRVLVLKKKGAAAATKKKR